MAALTGLIALAGVFLAGPYRTLQVRRPELWGRRISTLSHANVSLLAAVAVIVHAGVGFGVGLTWIGTALFFVTLLSGCYGMYVARGPTSRRAWLKRHRVVTLVFYAAILPHVGGQLLGWAAIPAVAAGAALWHRRTEARDLLSSLMWPLRKRAVAR